MAKPLIIFDGDCGFCRRWIRRWQERVRGAVDFEPYQTAATRYPQVPVERFEHWMHFVDENGRFFSGAEAAFRLFERMPRAGRLLEAYRHVPGFKFLAEGAYNLVARHRRFFSRII